MVSPSNPAVAAVATVLNDGVREWEGSECGLGEEYSASLVIERDEIVVERESLNTGNLGRLSETMDRFERQFVDMEVQGEFVERSMTGSAALLTPEDKVEELMDQVREECGLDFGVGLPQAGRNKVVVGVREEVSLWERVGALRARDCQKKLCGSLDGLFHIYHRAVHIEGAFRVSAEDSLHLVEALSMVITELPPDQAKKALEALCLLVVTPLQEIINQGPVILGQKGARELTVHIDRLAYIFRYVNHPEAVADAIQRLWPMFKAIFDVGAWDMRTMESLCKACKYAVRTSGRYMGVTIGAMLGEIQGLYQQHQQPCFLYLSSEVIKIFGSDPSCSEYLRNLIAALFSRTTCLLTSIQMHAVLSSDTYSIIGVPSISRLPFVGLLLSTGTALSSLEAPPSQGF
ncbi:hypothetical protein Droror1_Dr00021364 [Drosera rotundifolia]